MKNREMLGRILKINKSSESHFRTFIKMKGILSSIIFFSSISEGLCICLVRSLVSFQWEVQASIDLQSALQDIVSGIQ
jgi:hypothetical protein